jgi:hypothetical protein
MEPGGILAGFGRRLGAFACLGEQWRRFASFGVVWFWAAALIRRTITIATGMPRARFKEK